MRASVALVTVTAVLLARPALADGVAERAAALKVRFTERRPEGMAFRQSVARNLGMLRDLTRRAYQAGLDLPPVIIKGAPTLDSRRTIGFGPLDIPYALRASVSLKPRLMIVNLETLEKGSETWKPSEDYPPIVKKLALKNGGRVLSRALIELNVGREHVEEAFDAWTQAVEEGTHPGPRLRFLRRGETSRPRAKRGMAPNGQELEPAHAVTPGVAGPLPASR